MAAGAVALVLLSSCGAAHTGAATDAAVGRPVGTASPTTRGTTAVRVTAPPASAPATTRATPPAPASTARAAGPPYAVRETVLSLVDTSRPTVSHGHRVSASRSLTTLVWYPVRTGPSPLVVFGHGFDVGPETYTAMLTAWAAHGYVVAAPELPLSDPSVAGPNLDEGDIDQEPGDLRFVTDYLTGPRSTVAARIDRRRVAVAGHSDGAEAALAAATAPTPAGEPAYRAVVVMSGQPVPGAAGRNPPMLVTQGDADTINPMGLGQGAYDQAAPPRWFLLIEGGGHLPPVEAGSPWLAGIEATAEAFLDVYVARDPSLAALSAAARPYPNLRLTAG